MQTNTKAIRTKAHQGTRPVMLALTIVGLFAAVALAHGGLEHLMGTVTHVGEHSISLTTKDGRSVEVTVQAKTKYLRGTELAKLGEIKVGDRVVVHVEKKGNALVAHEVRLGAAPRSAIGKEARKKGK